MHCFALADTPLASFVSVCVLRGIVLCCFHAKKASFVGRPNLDSEWSRYKDLLAICGVYMLEHWMSPKWRFLRTKARRYDLAHLMVEATSVCELLFRVVLVTALQWQLQMDLVVFYPRKLYGLPLEPGSQDKLYLYPLYLELVAVYRGL